MTTNIAIKEETYVVAANAELNSPHQRYLHVLFSGESQTKPSHKQGPKLYDFYLLHIVISGAGYFQTERARYKLTAGDVFLIRPQQLITYESDANQPWHYVWIAFNGEHVTALLDSAGFTLEKDFISINDLSTALQHSRAIYTTFKLRQPSASLIANGYLHFLFATFSTSYPTYPVHLTETGLETKHPIAKQMVHYISTQYANPLSIEILADAMGYNRAYLSRVFKRYTGKSPRTYLLHYRLEQAKLLLRSRRDLTVEQVSASVGIQDALYFSKQFKNYFKRSPSQYRTELL